MTGVATAGAASTWTSALVTGGVSSLVLTTITDFLLLLERLSDDRSLESIRIYKGIPGTFGCAVSGSFHSSLGSRVTVGPPRALACSPHLLAGQKGAGFFLCGSWGWGLTRYLWHANPPTRSGQQAPALRSLSQCVLSGWTRKSSEASRATQLCVREHVLNCVTYAARRERRECTARVGCTKSENSGFSYRYRNG